MKPRKIALLGCGVVGSGVFEILTRQRDLIVEETETDLQIAHVCVRHPEKHRPVNVPREILRTDLSQALEDKTVDIVIEVIGGTSDAFGAVSRALVQGRTVITANKELVARHLPTLRRLERTHGGLLLYGASVCGSIPVLKIIDETMATERIVRLRGIVNGSTNYILTRLAEGIPWDSALDAARRNGYLEADCSDDLSGADAARKLSILAFHAFGSHVPPDRIATTGIDSITAQELRAAAEAGARIKLIAEAVTSDAGIHLSVAPRAIDASDPLADIRDEVNAVEIECEGIGVQRFSGRGAGSAPTANAVVSDLLDSLALRRYRKRSDHRSIESAPVSSGTRTFVPVASSPVERPPFRTTINAA